uniref:Uncharacterized protein n=1 Tax=Lotus japonicus TaxID=34305 RepID=I3S945_LOTJA|nr:unknown [Lotus japonicus]
MHDPIRFDSFRCFPNIKHQCLLNPQRLGLPNRFISSSSLPIPAPGRPVRPGTIRILPVSRRKEVPFFLAIKTHFWKLPWIKLVQIDFFDNGVVEGLASTFCAEVVVHQFFICWVESEPRWQL